MGGQKYDYGETGDWLAAKLPIDGFGGAARRWVGGPLGDEDGRGMDWGDSLFAFLREEVSASLLKKMLL